MIRQTGFIVGIAMASFLMGDGIARAQTISFADAMTTLAQDCGADVKKLCSGLNLGNNEIGNCLQGHAADASPQCIQTLASVSQSIQRRLAAQSAVFDICATDAKQHCKGVVGEVHLVQCLAKTERVNSNKCNQAITDAGWR